MDAQALYVAGIPSQHWHLLLLMRIPDAWLLSPVPVKPASYELCICADDIQASTSSVQGKVFTTCRISDWKPFSLLGLHNLACRSTDV